MPSTPHPLFRLTKKEVLLGEPIDEKTMIGYRVFRKERIALTATLVNVLVLGDRLVRSWTTLLRVPNGAIIVITPWTGLPQVSLNPLPLALS